MRVKKYLALTLAAVLATTMLTARPWEKEEDETDDASSVPVTSTDTSQDDDDDHDSGDDDSQPTKPSFKVSATNGNITDQSFVLDEGTGTYKATFTTNPTKDNYVASSVEATVTTAGETLSASWPDDTATRARTLSVRADAKLSLTTNDEGKTFTLTGIPADATSCNIMVEFKDPGYTIENDTYMVYNADGLLAWADVVLAGDWDTNCTLTANIDLTRQSWTPIGNYIYYDPNGYTGTFDGAGHTISNLNINTSNNDVGLFGYVGNGGTVQNVNLADVNISGLNFVGGVVGTNGGTIQGCMVSGSVSGNDLVGGVAGDNFGTVKGCCFAGGSVSGSGSVGGVVGYDYAGSITDCYWQAGTGGPSQGVGNGGDTTEVKDGNWNGITDNAFTSRFTVDSTTGKPVPKAIAENNTSAMSGLTQRVLDTARALGL